MARHQGPPAVRPLDTVERPRHRPRPVPVVAMALFVLGVAAGYFAGLTGGNAQSAPPATTTSTTAAPVAAGGSGLPVAEYEWTRQIPPEYNPDLWAVRTAIEHDGFVYLLIVDDIRNRISRGLWRSADGARWEEVPMHLGDDAVPTDLDTHRGDLLLSGWLGDRPAVWRSSSPAATHRTGQTEWSLVPLPAEPFPVGKLARVFSNVTTEVNNADEIVIVAKMTYGIEPADVGEWSTAAERPQIAVTGTTIWTRAVDALGSEDVRTMEVPSGIVVRQDSGHVGTDVVELYGWSGWHSTDGRVFTATDPNLGFDVAPVVRGFQEGFVASAATWGEDRYTLLQSEDGATWRPAPVLPPTQCAGSRPAVVGNGILLLASEDFDFACTSTDGVQWTVQHLPETEIARGGFVWFDGNEQRFLAVAQKAPEWAALVSRDGVHWERIGYTEEMTGGNVLLAGNRIVAVNRTGGRNSPQPWTVWVGESASRP